jgi:uncharacterized protein YjiS (DUF1127 family)
MIVMNLARAATVIAAPVSWLSQWWQRRRAMYYLSQAPDALLKDIGITRCDIEHVVRNGRR